MIRRQGGMPYKGYGFNSTRNKPLKPLTSMSKNQKKTKVPNPALNRTNGTSASHHITNMNDQLFIKRRQNHLNTCYNKRKNKLEEITKNNKQLYKRINSQKSLYSQKNLNKSTDSLKSSSRCSSRSSLKDKSLVKKNNALKKKDGTHLTIQSENINKTNKINIGEFRSMFMREQPNQPKKIMHPATSQKNRSFSLRNDKNIQKIDSHRTMTNMGLGIGMGNMLHRIAQEMLDGHPKQKRKALI